MNSLKSCFDVVCTPVGALLANNMEVNDFLIGAASTVAGAASGAIADMAMYGGFFNETTSSNNILNRRAQCAAVVACATASAWKPMSILSNHLIKQYYLQRFFPDLPNTPQVYISAVQSVLETMPRNQLAEFGKMVCTIGLQDPEHISTVVRLLASTPVVPTNRQHELGIILSSLVRTLRSKGVPIETLIDLLAPEYTFLQQEFITESARAVTMSMNSEEISDALQTCWQTYFAARMSMSRRMIEPASEDSEPEDLAPRTHEIWTEGVVNHVNETFNDARARQSEYEASLPVGSESSGFLRNTIFEYLRSSKKDKNQLIEDFEALGSEIYLDILKNAIMRAVESKEPLNNQQGPTQILPFCLHSVAGELEVLRMNQCKGNVSTRAFELQQQISVKVGLQLAIQSVLESDEYKQWKTSN